MPSKRKSMVFSAQSRFLLCAISPELRGAFEPLVGCPMILVKTENLNMWQKLDQVPYFHVCGARICVHLMLCALQTVGFWDVGWCWETISYSASFGLITKVDGFCFWPHFLALQAESFRKGDKRLEQLWGPLPTAPVWAKSWFLSSWFWWTLTRQSL